MIRIQRAEAIPAVDEVELDENQLQPGATSPSEDVVTSSPAPNGLSNPRFWSPGFTAIANAKALLFRGAHGPTVATVQQALLDLGYALPKYGADGSFGAETAHALQEFQADCHLPTTGSLDPLTLRLLDKAAPQPGQLATLSPDYHALFSDGLLTTTLAVGFDEDGADSGERARVLEGLAARGFQPLDWSSDPAALGINRGQLDPGSTYYWKQFSYQGRTVTALVQYVDRDSEDPKARFAFGMTHNELVLYGGHARYGSGPDFDEKDSPAGNFVLGVNAKGHRAGTLTPAYDPHIRDVLANTPNDLERVKLPDSYQLMFFSGCTTRNYLDELRGIPQNKSRANLDLLLSDDVLQWNRAHQNLFTVLDGVMSGQPVNAVRQQLQQDNGVPFTADGFAGNPTPS